MAAHLNDGRPCTITGIEPLHFLEDFLSLTDAQERLTELKNHATFGELSEAVKGAINNKKKRESDMYKGLVMQ